MLPALALLCALQSDPTQRLQAIADQVREKNHLPCLILGFRHEETTVVVASGTIAVDSQAPVLRDSKVHLGSNTKAMTAVLVAREVQAGKVKWETTVGSLFPELALPEALASCTFLEFLSHTSGLSSTSYPAGKPWFTDKDDEAVQHADFLRLIAYAQLKPKGQFLYANGNYVIAAAMLERATGMSYGELMQKLVFGPLGMNSVGFGPATGPNDPWPHVKKGETWAPISPTAPPAGAVADNAPVLSPAGRAHMSVEDHLKFASAFWGDGPAGFLTPENLEKIQTSRSAGNYGLGWIVADRPWGGGRVLTHSGSNTMNSETIWVAPKRKFAVVAYTNVAGGDVFGALDSAIGQSIGIALK